MSSLMPVPIIEVKKLPDESKKFIHRRDIVDEILLNPKVKDRKIVVLSVLGEYRKGKSFFLGYCLRYMYANFASLSTSLKPSIEQSSNWFGAPSEPLEGFKGKHGRQADTKGILFWPDVFLQETPENEKIAIILMDTQGLFEIFADENENAKIFGLTTLISSMQILNLRGEIQENQIEYLETATSLTKLISKFKKSPWKPFQQLLFLVRDWVDVSVKFGFEGGEKYLEEFLSTKSTKAKAQTVRNSIHESFKSIKCFLLGKPGDAVDDPNFTGEWAHLNEIFNANLKRLIESLLAPENLVKKSVFGKEVTCAEFRDYINVYAEAFQKAKLPETENIYEAMVSNEFKGIIEGLIENYKILIAKDVNFDHESFDAYIDEKHKSAKGVAFLEFHEAQKIEDAEQVSKYQSELLEEIEKFFKSWRETIMREHQAHLKHEKQVENLKSEMQKFQEEIEDFKESLRKQQEENENLQKLMEEERKKLNEEKEKLNEEINFMHMESQKKDEAIEKAQSSIRELKENHEKSLEEVQEGFDVKFKKFQAEMEEKSQKDLDEREKISKEHQREIEKIKKAHEKILEEQNRKLKMQEENLKRRDEEERREQEKKNEGANLQRKNLVELNEIIEDENEKIGIDILRSIANVVKVVSRRSMAKK